MTMRFAGGWVRWAALTLLLAATQAAGQGEYGHALEFAGNGEIAIQNSEGLNLGDEFTIEAWVWVDSYYADMQGLFYKWIGGDPGRRSYIFGLQNGQARFVSSATGEYGAGVVEIFSDSALPLGQWAHVAAVGADNAVRLYIGGIQQSAVGDMSMGIFDSSAPLFVGASNLPNSGALVGKVDEVRISSTNRYAADFSPPTTEYMADSHTMLLLHLNEGAGDITENLGSVGGDGSILASYTWCPGAITPGIIGDANLDGAVDLQDFGILKDNYAQPGSWERGDFNGDGTVGLQDFGLLKANFGTGLAITPIPEPAALALLAVGGLSLRRKRTGGIDA